MKITANMATMPQRMDTAFLAIESIYHQVDIIRLYLNNFEEIPIEYRDRKIEIYQGEDLKSSGKLFNALNSNEYYFCIDDDIVYPKNYVHDAIKKLNEYDDDIIVSHHGRIFKDEIKSYFKCYKTRYQFNQIVEKDTFVDVIGNGVSAWNTNNIKIDYKKFKYLYMDDICVSIQAHEQGKKRLVMAHPIRYLRPLKPKGFTLHRKYREDDATQTEMVRSVNW